MRAWVGILLLFGVINGASAALPACAGDIARYYGLPLDVLAAIHEVEGGRNGLSVKNDDGSLDRGLMQINTFWDDELKRFGITSREVTHNGCTNVAVGAWILATERARFGNWADAFAAYNAGAGNLPAGRGYARKVLSVWRGDTPSVRTAENDRQPIVIR